MVNSYRSVNKASEHLAGWFQIPIIPYLTESSYFFINQCPALEVKNQMVLGRSELPCSPQRICRRFTASMAEIVLATLNAKYIHAAFGLRYLLANLAELRPRASLLEFDIHQSPAQIAEGLLAENPKIVGLGVYIWNVTPTTELVATLKRLRPELIIILGGPEVSYECDRQTIVQLADYVITGEADLKFAEVCRRLLAGDKPSAKIIPAELPDLAQLASPYEL